MMSANVIRTNPPTSGLAVGFVHGFIKYMTKEIIANMTMNNRGKFDGSVFLFPVRQSRRAQLANQPTIRQYLIFSLILIGGSLGVCLSYSILKKLVKHLIRFTKKRFSRRNYFRFLKTKKKFFYSSLVVAYLLISYRLVKNILTESSFLI
jgi:hypothetical protein